MSADDVGKGSAAGTPVEGQWVCPECGRRVTKQLDTCPYCERGRQPAASWAPAATLPPVAPGATLPPATGGKSRRSCVVIAVLVLLVACFLTAAGGALYVVFTQPGAQWMGTVVAYFVSPTPTATLTPTATRTATPRPTFTPTVPPTATAYVATEGTPWTGTFPQDCGRTAATADFGTLRVGSQVVLGRHRSVDGSANWAPGMEPYVGLLATVSDLGGVDSQGCPAVAVDVDEGQYYWRIRDLVGPLAAPAGLSASAQGIPQECGMSGASVDFGSIQVGTAVLIERHRGVNGDANWVESMERYVGHLGVVTSLEGIDPAGCPVVKLGADDGMHYWRIRDLLITQVQPTEAPTSGEIPQACGMTLADVTFSPIRVGTLVILGRHREVDGDANWVSSMDQYVGQQARVARLAGTDTAGCPVVTVDVDNGEFYWRIRDMTIIE
jgi:hypothetical protein